jgi:peptidoglycan-associated lipoprotein
MIMTKKISLFAFVFLMAASMVFTGCTKKPKIDLSGLAEGLNGGAAVNGEFVEGPNGAGEGGLVNPFAEGQNDPEGIEKGGAWGESGAAVPGGSASEFLKNAERMTDLVVYFGYDQSEIGAGERAKVDALAKYLLDNPGKAVVIEGHTDERGSDEYNRALGERRALSVKGYLAILGIEDARMQTISYGEDTPAVANAAAEHEYSQNRRAEFLVGEPR